MIFLNTQLNSHCKCIRNSCVPITEKCISINLVDDTVERVHSEVPRIKTLVKTGVFSVIFAFQLTLTFLK